MKRLTSLIGLLALVSACSKEISDTSGRSAGLVDDVRMCSMVIDGSTSAKLHAFFGPLVPVKNLEGPATYCLSLAQSGTVIDASFRMEYEDDFGVRSYDTERDNVEIFYSDVSLSGNNTDIEIIFIDDYGFVQVIGTSTDGESVIGSVRFYNFPSYEDALNQQVLDAQEDCKDGTMTVAQCLGYNFPPTFWWNLPAPTSPAQQMIEFAQAILNDSDKSTTMGTIAFDLADVVAN